MRAGLIAGLTIATVALAPAAQAVPVLDGTITAGEYTTVASSVYNPTAVESNFQSPSTEARVGYSIYQASANGYYYGAVQVNTPNPSYGPNGIVATFSNLYFDLDPNASPGNGSDLGFELGLNSQTAFVPGIGAPIAITGVTVVANGAGTTFEYAIPLSYFTGPIAGLSYDPEQTGFPSNGGPVTLRLSQAFNYSVIGGAEFGPNRLGSITLAAPADVPEPASLVLLGAGAGLLAFARARRSRIASTQS